MVLAPQKCLLVMPCQEQARPPPSCLSLCSWAPHHASPGPDPAQPLGTGTRRWGTATEAKQHPGSEGDSEGFGLDAPALLGAGSISMGANRAWDPPTLISGDHFLNIPAWKCSGTGTSASGYRHVCLGVQAGVQKTTPAVPQASVAAAAMQLPRVQSPRRGSQPPRSPLRLG